MSGGGEYQRIKLATDRVSDLHELYVADLASDHPLTAAWRLENRKTLFSSRHSFPAPGYGDFPFAFIILSLSLPVCAVDPYKALQA